MVNVSENVTTLRKARGLSQHQLALALGVTASAIAAWEVGRNSPSTEMLCKLADVLECSTDDILGRKHKEVS